MLFLILFFIFLIVFFLSPWDGRKPGKKAGGCSQMMALIIAAIAVLIVCFMFSASAGK